jgi:hypothetical protein
VFYFTWLRVLAFCQVIYSSDFNGAHILAIISISCLQKLKVIHYYAAGFLLLLLLFFITTPLIDLGSLI